MLRRFRTKAEMLAYIRARRDLKDLNNPLDPCYAGKDGTDNWNPEDPRWANG